MNIDFKIGDQTQKSEGSEKKSSKFQGLVYFLGLLFITTSVIEYFSGNVVRTQIDTIQEYEESFIALEDNLVDLKLTYDGLWFDLIELDLKSYGEVHMLGADNTETYKDLLVFLLKFTNNWLDFKDIYVKNYANPVIQWLFTEQIFTFWYYRNVTTPSQKLNQILDAVNIFGEVELTLTNLSTWDIQWIKPDELNFSFSYGYTEFFYNETYPGFENVLEGRPGFIEVHMDKFDEYITNRFEIPKSQLSIKLSTIESAALANTVGVLVLNFLIDFSSVKRIFKGIYLFLMIPVVIVNIIYSISWFFF